MRSGAPAKTRLWPSCPGLAPPGFDCSHCSLRSVEGGFDDVRDVLPGRCSFSTSSISSSLLRRSRSERLIPTRNQLVPSRARAPVSLPSTQTSKTALNPVGNYGELSDCSLQSSLRGLQPQQTTFIV